MFFICKFTFSILGKVILTPAPSIDSAICYKLDPALLHKHDLSRAATKSGMILFEMTFKRR